MEFKTKNFIYELDFGGCIGFGFWSLPFSVGFIPIPIVRSLNGGWSLIFRCLCFQFSIEMWKWSDEVTDVGDSITHLWE